ncbi:hypothetical protein WMF28_30370 [Sorangium sp. So ce590]|uniref:hypothetical protein n=1 Tax=Sorangium sp. So ce590 TaxID=3133317 RepID=UPI003F5FE943
MLRSPAVSLPVAEPLALIDATLLFLVQVLLARHPELYAPPESGTEPRPPPGTRAAHHIIDAIREVHNAIEIYSAALPDTMSPGGAADDEIPS